MESINAYKGIILGINAILSFDQKNVIFNYSELFDTVFGLYEKVFDNSNKLTVLYMIIGCIKRLKSGAVQLEKVSEICFKLPKKTEQCIVLLSLSHVYWSNVAKKSGELLEILKRAVKLADLCVTGTKNLVLFVNILNEYLYFYLQSVPTIENSSINNLIELIFELLSFQYDKDFDTKATKQYLQNTISFIKARQLENKLVEINSDCKV